MSQVLVLAELAVFLPVLPRRQQLVLFELAVEVGEVGKAGLLCDF